MNYLMVKVFVGRERELLLQQGGCSCFAFGVQIRTGFLYNTVRQRWYFDLTLEYYAGGKVVLPFCGTERVGQRIKMLLFIKCISSVATTMLQLSLMVCLLSITTSQSQFQTTHPLYKKGHNFTIHSSQLVCSLPGPQGPGGNPGAPGSPGTMGPMGTPGKDGLDGEDGEKGERGDRGEQGRSGNPGKPGVKGREGVVGKHGPRGLKGARGAPGLAGLGGTKGEMGDTGETGAPGGCNCGTNSARSAFSVAMTKSYPKERLPIRFKRILLNEGNHYNATTGKFVCSVPGVYYFTYDITLANKHLAIGLVHNGQYKIKTFDANTGNHDVASGSTVLRLERQDQVWLQIFYSEQNGLFYDPFWTDSLFTGFLIYADQEYLNEVDRKANEDSSPSS